MPPTFDHLGLDISDFDQIGGLVSPSQTQPAPRMIWAGVDGG